jgi:hypothetical protein
MARQYYEGRDLETNSRLHVKVQRLTIDQSVKCKYVIS